MNGGRFYLNKNFNQPKQALLCLVLYILYVWQLIIAGPCGECFSADKK